MSDLLEDASHGGIDYYRWGEDYQVNVERRSLVRPLGRGHRLALVDDTVFWAVWTDGLEEMIDCQLGNCQSLAELEEYQLLAEALDRLGVFAALVTARTQHAPELDDLLLEPYQAVATGMGLDESGYFMGLALVHADESSAAANVDRLRGRIDETSNVRGQPWRELIEHSEVTSDGRIVLARLYGDTMSRVWAQFWLMRDPLLAHR